MLRKIVRLILCLALPLLVGTAAGYFTKESIYNWYNLLNKPGFTPPDYIFAAVWIVLYILMGISLFMILESRSYTSKTRAYFVWGVQLALNFAWSIIFFYWKLIGMAVAEIAILLLTIVAMETVFYPINKKAAWLLIPYLGWVFFAAILNMVIWEIN